MICMCISPTGSPATTASLLQLDMHTYGAHCFDAIMHRLADQIMLEAKISISAILNGRVCEAIANSQTLEINALLNRYMLVVAEYSMCHSWHIVPCKRQA